jgi:hypothetical protein
MFPISRRDIDLSTYSCSQLFQLRRNVCSAIATVSFLTLVDLPLEILCLIVNQISLKDFMACRLVSKEWKNVWYQPLVLLSILDCRFPGHSKMYETSVPAFLQVARRHLRRSWWYQNYTIARPANTLTWSTEKNYVDIEKGLQCLYNDGMLGWQGAQNKVYVKDLRKYKTLCLHLPLDTRLIAITQKWLILRTSRFSVLVLILNASLP